MSCYVSHPSKEGKTAFSILVAARYSFHFFFLQERDSDELSTSSIFGGAKATQEADNVLIIQDKRLTAVRGKKYLQVAKNRYSGDLGIMTLDFDKAGLSYATKKKKIDSNVTASEIAHKLSDDIPPEV